jgi:hypothetical protein
MIEFICLQAVVRPWKINIKNPVGLKSISTTGYSIQKIINFRSKNTYYIGVLKT